ncbi:MAG: hypothetical protein RR975_09525, partial [Clostridia bacterium]
LCICCPFKANGEAVQAPILHVRQGNVDASQIIQQLAPTGTGVETVLKTKQIMQDYGEDIGKEKAHRDVYTLDGMKILIQEPAGEVFVEWDSPARDTYTQTDAEQRAKYDADGDDYVADQETLLYQQTEIADADAQPMLNKANLCALELATKLGLELIPNTVSSIAYKTKYVDGQEFSMGQAKYGICRNGIPVETLGLWSAVSSTGYYVKAESITVEWCGDEVWKASIVTYQVEEQEDIAGQYISQEEAAKAVGSEIEGMQAVSGNEPFVDLCYMPVPDRKGALYAQLVPAWRFRFLGEFREEDNCHRVNAYTGEIIR